MLSCVRGRAAVVAIISLVFAACLPDPPTSTGPVALNVGSLLLEIEFALPVMARVQLTDPTLAFPFPVLTLSQCGYVAATQSFNCPPTTSPGVPGITVTRAIVLYDAANRPLSSPDAAATASLRLVTTTTGSFLTTTTGSFLSSGNDTTYRKDDALLSGLLESNQVLNETVIGRLVLAASFPGGTTSTIEDTTRVVNLRLPTVVTTTSWPVSGTVTDDETRTESSILGGPTKSRVAMTFDGTSQMTVTKTTNGTTVSCKINMGITTYQPCP
jgi:hypothetical protein